MDNPPILFNPIDHIDATLGHFLEYVIPTNTFQVIHCRQIFSDSIDGSDVTFIWSTREITNLIKQDWMVNDASSGDFFIFIFFLFKSN